MNILYRIYHYCIAAPILLVLTIITCIVTIVGCFFNRDYWGYYPAKWWSRAMCFFFGVRVKVENRHLIDRKSAYVFVANHQGAYDIFSIYGYLGHNFKWMMRKGLHNFPLVGWACHMAGHIMVDNHSAHGIVKTMSDAKKRLQKDMSIVVFPEGRRTDDGRIQPFKHGAFRLAKEFELPIVPITINGSYKVMSRTMFHVDPGKITLTIHEPIPPEQFGETIQDLTRKTFDSITSSLEEFKH